MAYGISNEGIVDIQTIKSKFNIEKVCQGNIFFNVGDGEIRKRYTELAARHSETVRFKHYIPSIIDGLATFDIEKLDEAGRREVEQVGRDEIESQQKEARDILSMVREHFAPILEGLEPNTAESRDHLLFSSDGDTVYYGVTLELYSGGFLHNHKQGDTLVAIVTSGFNFKNVKTEEGFTKKNSPLRVYAAEERKEPYADYEIHRILMTAILTGKPVEEIITPSERDLSAAVDMSYGNMSIKTMPLKNAGIEGGIASVVRDYELLVNWVRNNLLNPQNELLIKQLHHVMCLYKILSEPMTNTVFREGHYRETEGNPFTKGRSSETYNMIKRPVLRDSHSIAYTPLPALSFVALTNVIMAVEHYLEEAIKGGRKIVNESTPLKTLSYLIQKQQYMLR